MWVYLLWIAKTYLANLAHDKGKGNVCHFECVSMKNLNFMQE